MLASASFSVERLSQRLPWKEDSQVFLWNSGSEAVEAAIKVARNSTGKQNIIKMSGAVSDVEISRETRGLKLSAAIYPTVPRPDLRC
jgi:4-aminobutyrate aminotransferase